MGSQSTGHSEGIKEGLFCALRTEPKSSCECKNNYRNNCKNPDPSTWGYFVQGKKERNEKTFEAHHLLCIASVTEFIAKKEKIVSIVNQTKWCINAEKNMLAMPLWGHTINWYCDISAGGAFKEQDKRPPFENIPQHDYDHNSKLGYKKKDLDPALQELADQIEEKANNHEVAIKELKEALDTLSDEARSMLNTRGKRVWGTHAAWEKGREHPDSDWYLPFSMASTADAEPRRFPTTGSWGKLWRKISTLVNAFGKWGA